jgi:hypothetical protein
MPRKLPDFSILTNRLVRAFNTRLAEDIPARIGNPVNHAVLVSGTDRDGMVYIHGLGTDPQSAYTAINNLGKDALVYDAPVLVRRVTNGYVITSKDLEQWDKFWAGAILHDQSPVLLNQLMYGTAQPTNPPSMQVRLLGAIYDVAGVAYRVPDQLSADFSTSPLDVDSVAIEIPTTNLTAIGVCIQVDPTAGTLSYKQGAAFNANMTHRQAFDSGYYPQRDTDQRRITWVRLVAGMTAISYEHLYNAPELLNGEGSTGTAVHTHADVPNGGTLNASVITAGTLALTQGGLNADISATGPGYLMQATIGSAVTVGAATIDVTGTAGENLSARNNVYLATDGKWYKLGTSFAAADVGRQRGIVVTGAGIAQNYSGRIRTDGVVTGYTGLSAGYPGYCDGVGELTQTKPTPDADGEYSILMGMALTTTTLLILHQPILAMIRDTVLDDGTLEITHYSDGDCPERHVYAIENTIEQTIYAQYASANQDSDVTLEYHALVTYGTDQCSGGAATASETYAGSAAANAVDNGTADWESGPADTQWWQYDFGAGVTKTIRKLTMTADSSGVYYARCPRDFTLKASNTGAFGGEEVTLLTVDQSGNYWANGETKTWTFYCGTAYRYYRINMTDKQEAFGSTREYVIQEIEMMEAATWTAENSQLAQSFVSTGYYVKTVNLWLKKVGSPTGNLTVEIQGDSGGSPDGTAITYGTSDAVAASTLTTSYGWITFTFTSQPTLSAATTYWIVLKTTDSVSEVDYVVWGADGSTPGFTDGEMKAYASAAWAAESKDACFQVLSADVAVYCPLVCGRWTSAFADVAVRFDDTALVDFETTTTFKNITGATLDMTAVVSLP